MSMTKAFLFFIFLVSLNCWAKNQNSASIAYDQNGFVTCFQQQKQTYMLYWDRVLARRTNVPQTLHVINLPEYARTTGHFLRNCKDRKFLNEIPAEASGSVLVDLRTLPKNIPLRVQHSIQQVQQGADKFYPESTAAEYIANRQHQFQKNQPEVLSQLRKDVGDEFAAVIMQLFIRQIVPAQSSCQEYIGSCDFYLCQEQKNPCGLDGYNLGFGYKYCSRSQFQLTQSMRTASGQDWVSEVLVCLQKASSDFSFQSPRATCSQMTQSAFDSHPGCYLQSGFCSLPLPEKTKVFKMIKQEIFSEETLHQGEDILKGCLQHQIKNQNPTQESK